MPATIFSGSKVKTLKSTLSLNGGADIISSTTNPQTSAVSAEAGSLLLNTTSGTMYRKLDSGSTTNWVEVGAGTGGKNYIKNPDFDGGATTSWSMQKVSLSSFIPTGNIGAADAGHSIATSSSLPLEGANSLLVQGASAFTAGNCLVSNEFTIDREDVAKVMGWSFAYEAITTNMDFSGTTGNTWAVYIAEVTTGTPNTVVSWIQPAGVYNLIQGVGVGLAAGTFQTTATESSAYRIVLVCINSEAAATTLKVDDFQLGPQKVVYGSPVTDWVSYTPTVTGSSGNPNGTALGKYRRVGDSIEIEIQFAAGTVAGSGFYEFSVPSGVLIDTNKLPSGTEPVGTLGVGNGYVGSVNYIFSVNYRSTTTLTLRWDGASAYVGAAVPAAWGSGDRINFVASFPASGLSSSVQMSNDTDTRVVAARAFSSNAGAWPTSDTVINYATVSYDTHAAVTTGAGWSYRVSVSGYYKVNATHEATISGSTTLILRIRKNGSQFATATFPTTSALSNVIIRVDGQNYFNAGDTIDVVASATSAAGTYVGSASASVLTIERLSGPATIAASETVACVYSSNSGQTINNTATTVVYEDKDFDTHGAYNLSTGIFTVPVSGKYLVAAGLYYNSSTNGVNFQAVQAGSVAKTYRLGEKPPSTATSYQLSGSVEFNCIAGDTLKIQATASAGGSGLFALTELNYLTITRVGN